jgi:hypothetical protein
MRESAGVVLKATPNPAIARTLNLAGAVVSVGAFFLQGPFIPVTVLLAVLPVMACLLFFQTNGGYDVAGMRYDPRSSVSVAFIGCSLALMLRSIKDLPLLSSIPTLLVALAGGLVLTVLIGDVERKRRESGKFKFEKQKLSGRLIFFACLLIFTASYFFGATVQANALFDRSVPVIYRVVVLRKHVSSGRYAMYWELWLAPWGPRQEAQSEWVAPSLYRSVAPGQSVCVDLHAGALKIPWCAVNECP